MDYFTVAITTSWILGVTYTAMAILIAIGLKISTPIIPTRLYKVISYLLACAFLGVGLHYLHLGYFGAIHGILPSQESLFASASNVIQAVTIPPTIVLAWYLRLKVGRQADD